MDPRSERWRPFAFDASHGVSATQTNVFADLKSMSSLVVDGYCCGIMAYGQTGSGKTYTMQGTKTNPGINQQTLIQIFDTVRRRENNPLNKYDYTVVLSMMEIYNEDVVDLLPANHSKNVIDVAARQGSDKLEISITKDKEMQNNSKSNVKNNKNASNGQSRVVVRGLTSITVSNEEEAQLLFEQGMNQRAVASTDVHQHSSRSHCIVRIDIKGIPRSRRSKNNKEDDEDQKEKEDDNNNNNNKESKSKRNRKSLDIGRRRHSLSNPTTKEGEETLGRLYLVDLAGSERVNKSNVKGKQLIEAKNINRSLSALGDVIEALDKKRSHIPYRNSTLTRLLQDALCSRSIVAVIVTICPTESTAEESLSSLYFAQRLRNIEMGVATKKISIKNNLDENKILQEKMNQLVLWRKKAITELEELRGALKSKEEHHLRKTNAKDRNLKLQNDDYNHQIDSFKQKLVTMSKKLKIKTENENELNFKVDRLEKNKKGQHIAAIELERNIDILQLQQKTLNDEISKLRKQLANSKTQNKLLSNSKNNSNNSNNSTASSPRSPLKNSFSLLTSSPQSFHSPVVNNLITAPKSPHSTASNASTASNGSTTSRQIQNRMSTMSSASSTPSTPVSNLTGPPLVKGTKASRARAARGKAVRKYQEMSPSEQSRNGQMLSERIPSLSLAGEDMNNSVESPSQATNGSTISNSSNSTGISLATPNLKTSKTLSSSVSKTTTTPIIVSNGKMIIGSPLSVEISVAPTPVVKRSRSGRSNESSRFGWGSKKSDSGIKSAFKSDGVDSVSGSSSTTETKREIDIRRRSTRIRQNSQLSSPSKIPKPKSQGGRWR